MTSGFLWDKFLDFFYWSRMGAGGSWVWKLHHLLCILSTFNKKLEEVVVVVVGSIEMVDGGDWRGCGEVVDGVIKLIFFLLNTFSSFIEVDFGVERDEDYCIRYFIERKGKNKKDKFIFSWLFLIQQEQLRPSIHNVLFELSRFLTNHCVSRR